MKSSLAALVAATITGAVQGISMVCAAAQPVLPAASVAADATLSVRTTLTVMPLSAQLRLAVDRFKKEDASASFTWLRGHVDAFTARPKLTIPDYARPLLLTHGLNGTAVVQPTESTTTLPPLPGGTPNPPPEQNSSDNVAFDGVDDAPDPQSGPTLAHETVPVLPQQTTWYAQTGNDAVKEILIAFLRKNNDVFEIDDTLLAQRLPNLTLVKYGVGRHFRRAEFTQTIAGTPLLDGKTLVLFDLNWNVVAISRQLMTPAVVAGRDSIDKPDER
jgi:hypothetical protein